MEFKCTNEKCENLNKVSHYYSVSFKYNELGESIPDISCPLCKNTLTFIPDTTSIRDKNIWVATPIGSPSKEWTKHGKNSIY